MDAKLRREDINFTYSPDTKSYFVEVHGYCFGSLDKKLSYSLDEVLTLVLDTVPGIVHICLKKQEERENGNNKTNN